MSLLNSFFRNASQLAIENPPKILDLVHLSPSHLTPSTTYHTGTMQLSNNEIRDRDAAHVHEWLTMCLPGSDGTHTLHQALFTHNAEQTFTNADFCSLLKNEYEEMCSRSSLGVLSPRARKLIDIRFVKFQTKETTTSYGTPAREPRVEVIGERCLPEGEDGWVSGKDLIATVGAGMAMVAEINSEAFRVSERLNIHKLVPRRVSWHNPSALQEPDRTAGVCTSSRRSIAKGGTKILSCCALWSSPTLVELSSH